jgi:5-methylthioribose kinase
MDPTWIAALRKTRSGFANVIIHQFLTHLRANVAKLTSKQKKELRDQLLEWAVSQMIDSGLFNERFLRAWEMKPEAKKTWEATKAYFKEEYEGIEMFEDPTPRRM